MNDISIAHYQKNHEKINQIMIENEKFNNMSNIYIS